MRKIIFSIKILLVILIQYSICAYTPYKEISLYDKKWECKDGLHRVLKWCEYNGHIIPLYGFVDKNDSVVVPIKYDYAEDMSNGYALVAIRTEPKVELFSLSPHPVKPNYRYGYISKSNEVKVLPFCDHATSISPIDSSIIIGFSEVEHHFELPSKYLIKKHKVKWSVFIDNYKKAYGWYSGQDLPKYEGEVVFPTPFDNMQCDKLQSYETGDMSFEGFTIKQKGVIVDNETGSKVVIKHLCEELDKDPDWISFRPNDNHLIKSAHGYVGISEYLPSRFDAITFCSNNILAASYNGKWGVINLQGDIIQPFIYDFIKKSDYNDKLFIIYDFTGEWVYDFFAGTSPKFFYGCMDSKGKILVPAKHNRLHTLHPNLIFAKDRLWSVYDMSGNLLHDNKFENFENNGEEYIIINLKEKEGCMDKYGNIILDPVYENVEQWHTGTNYFIVEKDNKIGVVDDKKNIMLDFIYEGFPCFDKDNILKPFRKNGKQGYINAYTFNEDIPAKYDVAYEFECGIAIVAAEKKYGVINTKGETIIPLNFIKVFILDNKIFAKDAEGNNFSFDLSGNQIEL